MKAPTLKKKRVMVSIRHDVSEEFNEYYDRLEEPKPSKTALLSYMVRKYITEKGKKLGG